MISAWELYLWTRLDVFSGVGFNLLGLFGFFVGGGLFGMCRYYGDTDKEAVAIKPFVKVGFIVGCIMLIVSMVVPTRKDAAMIWIIPQLATVENAELLKGEAAEIYAMAKEALKESIGVKEKE